MGKKLYMTPKIINKLNHARVAGELISIGDGVLLKIVAISNSDDGCITDHGMCFFIDKPCGGIHCGGIIFKRIPVK